MLFSSCYSLLFRGKKANVAKTALARKLDCFMTEGHYITVFDAEQFERMGSVHFCGQRKKWHYAQMVAQPLNCLYFGNPEMQDFEETHGELLDEGICAVGFGQGNGYDFVRKMMDSGIRTGVTFLIRADSREEARRILEEHTGR